MFLVMIDVHERKSMIYLLDTKSIDQIALLALLMRRGAEGHDQVAAIVFNYVYLKASPLPPALLAVAGFLAVALLALAIF